MPASGVDYQLQGPSSSSRYRSDALIKSSVTLDGAGVSTLTEHVLKGVEADLRFSTRATRLNDFLDTFFPKCDNSSALFNTLKSIGAYDASADRWKSLLAQPRGAELPYYIAFADAANAIGQAACGQNEAPKRFWLDRHSSKPKSFTHAAANRPDVVNVLGNKDDWEMLSEAILKAEVCDMFKHRAKVDETDCLYKEQYPDTKVQVSWVRTIVPVEIKPKTVVKLEEAQKTITQLCGYMRQILREQYDRQYVFGMILFHSSLSLWYRDRSGLVGADSNIDIHNEPDRFIRVIAHFSTADPFQLGWDRTMKLYRGLSEKAVYSHSPEIPLNYFETLPSLHLVRWLITVCDADAKPHFLVTIRALSVARSEIMCGRGTLVWLAMDLAKKEVVVLKQSWRPLTSTSENDFYGIAGPGDHISRVYLNHEVPGTRTFSDLRKDVHTYPFHQRSTSQASETAKRKATPDEVLHVNVISGLRDFSDFPVTAETVVERVLTRLVLKDYGWPLKYFLTMKEFLTTVHGTFLGKILLNSLCFLTQKTGLLKLFDTSGRISDMDHSKHDVDYHDPAPLQEKLLNRPNLLTYIALGQYPLMSDGLSDLFASLPASIDDTELVTYYKALLKSLSIEIKKSNTHIVSFSTIVFQISDDLTKMPPSFASHVAQHGERTGTLPYISHKILDKAVNVVHVAIHDMESFFWVVIYICLTRAGPGGPLRHTLKSLSEADDNDTYETRKIRALVYFFFDAPESDILYNKRKLFDNPGPEHLQEHILDYFDPYFAPLKPVVLEWWRILNLAYHFRDGFEYRFPILPFQRAIEEALQRLPDNYEEITGVTAFYEAERSRREGELDLIRKALTECDVLETTDTGPVWDSPERPETHVGAGSYDQGFVSVPVSADTPSSPTPLPKSKKFRAAGDHAWYVDVFLDRLSFFINF
ncbi:uncharacterized protein EV420DRAFT_1279836 [Desarmillaria tabescens]|uniref:Fungal-type protein kinase domain-containing protein n=1 Tax=Armillaria tabescens TaxID=1929756 RepID=A0AA39MLN1_ARMTA|nr:uncharacterized protein EV420DRAFT_1279836 [Desarmillaria tabescens]KAK0438872.1 hypothetical protein EV420DRAFT_1279836 [Desarmillaria tabescens]